MPKLNTSKTEWDLSPLLKNDNDPAAAKYRTAITKATEKFVKKWRDRTDYLEDPKVLAEALSDLEAWETLPGNGNEAFYFALRGAQDSIDPKLKAKDNQVSEFSRNVYNQLQFFWLSLGNVNAKLQPKFLADKQLEPFRHLLERTFLNSKYRLSEPEEKILVLKSAAAHGNWVQMTSDFLAKEEAEVIGEDGKKKTATLEDMLALSGNQNKKIRDAAGAMLDKIYARYAEIAEVELNSILGNKKVDDELRGYERPDSSRHISSDIDTEVVDALVEAVSESNKVAQDFYKLKAKLLGLPILKYHERTVEYGKIDKDYTYDDACRLVHEVFGDLDPQFAELFEGFLNEGRIDVYPRKGKGGGAFCAYNAITQPVYVLLNFTGKLRDVTTLAHELGHGINDELMKRKQNPMNFSTSLATAEVASTFMEDFVIERLGTEADDEFRLALMMNQLGDQIQTIFRQVAGYRFEQDLHREYREKGYLSSDDINVLFKKNMTAYMGSAAEGCENWWVYWSHIRNFFYVYSYASGLLISKAMQGKVRQDPKFIEKVKVFLETGTSKSPKDTFAAMGIDITNKKFWQDGVAEIGQLLKDTTVLAKKLGKL